ncbi:MAG: hypothetical protein MZV70_41835 [Desulfobacterales bacterium]|nr:hypothetical protein [Desulfobacterales bacterium]
MSLTMAMRSPLSPMLLKRLVQGVGDALVGAPRAEHRRPRRVQQAIHG